MPGDGTQENHLPVAVGSAQSFLCYVREYRHLTLVRPLTQDACWLPEGHQNRTKIGLRPLAGLLLTRYARCSAIQSEEKRGDIDAADCAIRPRANADDSACDQAVQNQETRCFRLARLRPQRGLAQQPAA